MLFLQNSEHNHSFDDLDEDENHVLPPLEEPQAAQERQEEVHGAVQGIRCGGEDGESGGAMSQRPNAAMSDSSMVRRERGKVVLFFFFTGLVYSLVSTCSLHR